MKTNLWTGQKTGFFLDQSFNIDVVYEHILRTKKPKIKLLDICSYVGQWSAKLSKGLQSKGVEIECTAIDSSANALAFTKENVEAQGGKLNSIRCDVFKADWTVEEKSFDVVICDPPALIKNRKDLEVGKHGYMKLNTLALQKCAKDAIFVSCSCSGVLSRDDFKEVLQKAVKRSGRRVLWVGEGRQSPDHPVRDWFPEGEYLKCFLGRVLD
jgi:23S rRNA (cytosine1962-C5)-methyltransferase